MTSTRTVAWKTTALFAAIAFAIALTVAPAYADGGDDPTLGVLDKAAGVVLGASGSSGDTLSGGAEGQGKNEADLQQEVGEAVSQGDNASADDADDGGEPSPSSQNSGDVSQSSDDGSISQDALESQTGESANTPDQDSESSPSTPSTPANSGKTDVVSANTGTTAQSATTAGANAGKSSSAAANNAAQSVSSPANAAKVSSQSMTTKMSAQSASTSASTTLSMAGTNSGTTLSTAAAKQDVNTVFAGAAAKGNLVMDEAGTVNPGAWWAYYTTEQDVTFNGQTFHVLPKSLLVGAFDDADSKEVYTKYYVKNENLWRLDGGVSFSNTGQGYSTMPWYTTTVAGQSSQINYNTDYIRTFGGVQPVYMLGGWFQSWTDWAWSNLKEMHLDGMDTSKCESFAVAFYDKYNSIVFDGFGGWDTSNVKTFQLMFAHNFTSSGDSLTLDMHNWDMTNANVYSEMFITAFSASLDALVLGNGCVLEGTSFSQMGRGMWYIEEMEDESLADSLVYPGILIDATGLEQFYRKGGNSYGIVHWRRLGSEPYYTITYNGNGGSGSVANSYAVEGSSVILPPNGVTTKSQLFQREGYRIKEWNTSSNGSGTKYALTEKITPTSNMNLYAIWELADGFRIQYDVDGALPGYADKAYNADGSKLNWKSTNLIPDTEPAKANYTFKGWYVADENGNWLDRSGNIVSSPNCQAASNTEYKALTNNWDALQPLVLKAYFEENTITIKYTAESASSATMTVTGSSGSQESAKPISQGFKGVTATVAAGYHALYWKNNLFPYKTLVGTSSFDANGVETNVLSSDQVESISYFGGEYHDVTFTLIVAGNSFTLHFDPNTATVNRSIPDMSMKYGDVTYLPSVVGSYVKPGYSFGGWATAKSQAVATALGIAYKVYSIDTPFAESALLDGSTNTLYAVWNEHQANITFRADYPMGYVVQYDDDGTTVLATFDNKDYTQTVGRSTGTIMTPTAVAHDGYRFLYWIDDVTQKVVSPSATWSPSKVGGAWPESSAYRAKFEAKTYVVSFDANGGSGSLSSQTVTFAQTATLKPNSVNSSTLLRAINNPGYLFSGWNTKADGSGTHYDDQGQMGIDAAFLKLVGADGLTATLYAEWSPRPITVRYNAGASGVSNPASYTQTVAHNEPFDLTSNAFRRYGYSFAGWSRSFEGAKVYENAEKDVVLDILTEGTEVNLYALWDAVVWKVSFANSDKTQGLYYVEGTPVNDDPVAFEVSHGATVGVDPTTYPETDFKFLYWKYEMQTDASGATRTGTILAGDLSDFAITGAATITAMWAPAQITVRYDPGQHGLFSPNHASYTYWENVVYGSNFYPQAGEGGYTYNGGIDDAITNENNIGNPMGEEGWAFAYWSWYDADGVYRTSLGSQFPKTVTTSYTFVAHWKPVGQTLTFDANGGAPTSEYAIEPVPLATGQTTTLPDETKVTRVGYYFTGWGTSADGPVEYLGGQTYTMPPGDQTLYAQWDPYKFTLHFDTQGGSAVEDSIGLTWDSQYLLKDQADGNYLSAIASAKDVSTAKPGYTFGGWFVSTEDMAPHLAVTNSDVLGKLFEELVGSAGPTDGMTFTLYAKWTQNISTIHYLPVFKDGIGDTVGLSDKATQVQPDTSEKVSAVDGVASEHTAVAGPGYTFMYWADADGNILTDAAAFTPTKGVYDADAGDFNIWATDTYYYAVFVPITYTLAFDANGGMGSIASVTLDYDQEYALPVNAYDVANNKNADIYLPGYVFIGWASDAAGTGTLYDPGDKVTKLSSVAGDTVTLYARWRLADQTLTFHDNYNDPETTQKFDVYGGQDITLPGNSLFTCDHYNLVGWNTKADGSGTSYKLNDAFTVPAIAQDASGARNFDLYAMWEGIHYTVRFNASAGDATGKMDDQTLTYDLDEALTPNAFARQGYSFLGWANVAGSDTVVYTNGQLVKNLTTMEGALLQLFAVWAPNANKVSFVNDAVTYGKVVAYDQNVLTGGNAIYNDTTVAVTPAKNQALAGWTYAVYADGTDKVIESGVLVNPADLVIKGRTVFTARWSSPYAAQYLPGIYGAFEAWISEMQWEDAVVPAPPDTIYDTDGTPLAKGVSYEFAGWKDQNGDVYLNYEAIRNALAMTKEGWIFEAQWTPVPAPLELHPNGGTWKESPVAWLGDAALNGVKVTLPGQEVLNTYGGHTLVGWSTEQDGSGATYAPGSSFTLDKNVSMLYAQWQLKSYTVKYNMGNAPSITDDVGVSWDHVVAKMGEGWLDGTFYTDHEFLGWATAADGTVPSGLGASQVANGITVHELFQRLGYSDDTEREVTLFAIWKIRDVEIVYYSLGGHGTVQVNGYDAVSTYRVSETFPADGLPRGATATASTGYNFLGWYDKEVDDEYGPATLLSNAANYTPGKAGLTQWANASYWAWFAPYTYTIVFDPNDTKAVAASAGMAPQTMSYDKWEKLTERNLQVVNPGHTFKGWNSKPDGTGLWYNDGQMVVNLSKDDGGQVTLYAQWAYGDYRIVFEKNAKDAFGTMDQMAMQYGETRDLTANAFRYNGYKFLGWAENENATTADYTDGQSFMLASGEPESVLTLYAVWSIADNYILRFVNEETSKGSITDDTGVVAAGDPVERNVTFNATPGVDDVTVEAADGYAFVGWDIVYWRYNTDGSYSIAETISSGNPESINSFVIKGYLTEATPIWEKTYRVTYLAGDHGDFTDWSSIYRRDKTAVPTFGSEMAEADLAAVLWTAISVDKDDPYMKTAPKATDDDLYAFAYWEDTVTTNRYYTWDDLEGLTFNGADITLKAVWTDATQQIVYNWVRTVPNEYTGPATQDARAHMAATLLDASGITSDGYWLVGWATVPNGAKAYELGQQILMPAETLNLYAIWQEKTVIVKYKIVSSCLTPEVMGTLAGWGLRTLDDGTLYQEIGLVSGKVYDGEGNIVAGSPLAVYANPRPGYAFASWMSADSEDEQYKKYPTSPFVVEQGDSGYEEATYWALFHKADQVRIAYTIALDGQEQLQEGTLAQDAGWVSLVEEYVDKAEGVAQGSTAIAYDGWTFAGWYDSEGNFLSNAATYVPEKPSDVWPTTGMTFVAHFKAASMIAYTVEHWLEGTDGSFSLPSGADYVEALEGAFGSTVTATPKEFTGYTYDATASRNTKSAKLYGSTPVTLVLYYSANRFTVTYQYKDGVKPAGAALLPETAQYRYGETVTMADVPSAAGYTFAGWMPTDDSPAISIGTNGSASVFAIPDGDVVLVGVWTPVDVTIDFNPNGGVFATNEDGTLVDAVQPKTLPAGTNIELPTYEHVSYAGRVLVGWSTDPNGPIEFTQGQTIYMPYDLPDVKKTLYAQWREAKVKVQFAQVVRSENAEAASGYDYVATTGTLSNTANGNLIMDNGLLSMLVGSVTGKVYGYYAKSTVEATAPYGVQATAPIGHSFIEWMDESGNTYSTADLFALKRGTGGLYHEQVYTAVYEEADPVSIFFKMITETDGAVNSSAISLNSGETQLVRPISGTAKTVTVIIPDDDDTYSFVGWYRQLADASGQPLAGSTRDLVGTDLAVLPARNADGIYENVIYFAMFHELNEGQASFLVEHYLQNLDGSTYADSPEYTQKLWDNANTTAAATAMTIPGFTLSAGSSFTGGTLPTGGESGIVIKLYYDRNKYQVTYSYAVSAPSDAPALPNDVADVLYGTTFTATQPAKLTGRTFVGWASPQVTVATAADGTQTFTMPDADVTLTGYFEAIVYDVDFVADAAKGTITGTGATQTAPYGTNVQMTDPSTGAIWVVAEPLPSSGNIHYGWNYVMTDDDGAQIASGFVVDPSTLIVEGDMVFTANWIEPITITYLVGDTTAGDFTEKAGMTIFTNLTPADLIASKAAYNAETDANGNPRAQVGYVFVGWQWTDPETGALLNTDVTAMPTYADYSYTFTALWKATVRTLVFDVNGGTWVADPNGTAGTGLVLDVGATNPLPGDPNDPTALATRDGYHIIGWGESAGGVAKWELGEDYTMPAADTTLYLIWAEDDGINIYYIAGEGGTVSLPTEQVKAVTGGAAGSTATPKGGRVFAGWVLVDASGNVLQTLSAPATIVPDASWFTPAVLTEGMTFKALFEEGPAVTIAYQIAALDLDGSPMPVNSPTSIVGGYVLDASETVDPVTGHAQGTTALAYTGYRLLYWKDANGKIVGIDQTLATATAGSIMPQRNADGAYEAMTYTAVFQKLGEVLIQLDPNADDATVSPAGVRAYAGEDEDPSTWVTQASRPGYTLDGWSTDKDATTPDADLEATSTSWTAPTNNITLFAVWKANPSVTVTLDAGDGLFSNNTNADNYTAPEGIIVAVSSMPQPTRDGYTFLGWSATSGAPAPDAGLAVGDTWAMSVTTLHAVWEALDGIKFTVQYDLYRNGVLVNSDLKDDTHTGVAGTNADANDYVIDIEGYELDATQPDAVKAIAGNGSTVVKLRYNAKSNALTVDLVHGKFVDGATDPSGTYLTDTHITLPTKDDVEREGYDFVRWELAWTGSDGTTHTAFYDPSVTGQETFPMPPSSAEITAVWQPKAVAYTIEYYKAVGGVAATTAFATYNGTGATGTTVDAITHDYTTNTVGVPAGYGLRANQTANASGTIAGDGSLVLKVYFDALPYTLTYHANGGTLTNVTTPVTVYTDQVITLPGAIDVTAPITKYFEGWWTSAVSTDADTAGITPYTTTITVGTANIDLYAVWAENDQVKVVLVAGEGLFANGLNSEGFESHENVPVAVSSLPTPTRAGYTLLGWSETQGATAADANLGMSDNWTVKLTTLYAVWKANDDTAYTIEYYKVVDGVVGAKVAGDYSGKGTTGTTVDALTVVALPAEPAGYTLRPASGQTDASGTIAGNGTLVLKVYYDADEQAFTISLGDGASITTAFQFNNQGGTAPDLTAGYVTDSIVTLPQKGDVSRLGYELEGWTVTPATGGSPVDYNPGDTFTTPASAVTIVPKWKSTISDYTVNHIKRFDGGTATELSLPIQAPTGTVVKLGTDFDLITLTGYTYDTNSVSTGTVAAGGTLVINLYYDADPHTVTYDFGSASDVTWAGHTTPQHVVNAWTGKTVVIEGSGADAPVRPGYEFLGWTTTTGATLADSEYAPGSNLTLAAADYLLYAVWEAFDVVLKFEGFDDTTQYLDETPVTGSKGDIDTKVGETLALGDTGFARPGYTFDGWYLSTDTSATPTLYNGNFTVPVVGSDGEAITLVAAWTPKEYTIVYKTKTNDSNGASIVVASETVRFNEIDDARLNWTPSLIGYDFNGWSTSTIARLGKKMADGKDYAFLAGNDESKATITLNALWTAKKVTITYMLQGKTAAVRTLQWGQTGIDDVVAAADGYTFNGWYTSSIARLGKKVTSTMTVGELMNNNDTVLTKTLYASITAKRYTIAYDAQGGRQLPNKTSIQWTSNNLIPGDLQLDGYCFDGWYTDTSYTTRVTSSTHYYDLRSAGDDDASVVITLYAKWTALSGQSLTTSSVAGGTGAIAILGEPPLPDAQPMSAQTSGLVVQSESEDASIVILEAASSDAEDASVVILSEQSESKDPSPADVEDASVVILSEATSTDAEPSTALMPGLTAQSSSASETGTRELALAQTSRLDPDADASLAGREIAQADASAGDGVVVLAILSKSVDPSSADAQDANIVILSKRSESKDPTSADAEPSTALMLDSSAPALRASAQNDIGCDASIVILSERSESKDPSSADALSIYVQDTNTIGAIKPEILV